MKYYLRLIAAMLIFGSIGIFVRAIDFPSGMIAFVRGVIGTAVLLAAGIVFRRRPSGAAIRKNLPLLLYSGAAIGANWICLFEAYRHTLVSTATLCYYCAPVIVVLFSPLLLREKLTARKIFCAAAALAGMILVAGVFNNGAQTNTAGILFGLAAAAFYASIVFCNKFLRDIAPLDATAVQLGTAAAVLLPYVLLTTKFSALAVTPKKCILLLLLGAVHTGAAYLLYFSAIPRLKAQTAALLSYLDPVSALFFSAVFLNERLSAGEACGAVLILAAAIFGTLEGARGSEKIPAEHS